MAQRKRGFSLIELMVVIALVAIVATIALRISIEVLAKSNVVTQAVTIKGMVTQAKGFAMTHGVPVLFEYSGNELRATADFNLDGIFGESSKEMVLGTWDGAQVKGIDLDFNHVSIKYDQTIDHWSGFQTGTSNFQNFQFLISPLGLIKDPAGSHGPVQGAIFVQNPDNFLAAVYLSPLGDMKMAIKESAETEWSWND